MEMNINKEKLEAMKYKILQMEDENAKTKALGYGEMVDKIKKCIKDEVNKKY